MGFRNPITSLSASAITPGALPPGVQLAADQITDGLLGAEVVARNIADGSVGGPQLVAGAVTAGKIAAGAIDGYLITGATVQTSHDGNRVRLYDDDDAGTGVLEFYAGFPDEEPGRLIAMSDSVNKSLRLDGGRRTSQATAGGNPEILLRSGAQSGIDLSAYRIAIGAVGYAQRVDVNAPSIYLNGNVFGQPVHYEWTGPAGGLAVGSGAVWTAGTMTKDTAASVGTGPYIYANEHAIPGAPGIYAVSFHPQFATQIAGRAYAEIKVDGVTVARSIFNGEEQTLVTIPAVRLTTFQAVRGIVYQASGAPVTLNSRLRLTLLERL